MMDLKAVVDMSYIFHEVFSLQVGHSDTGNKVAPQPLQHRLFGKFKLSR
jgi:hypothetical protein